VCLCGCPKRDSCGAEGKSPAVCIEGRLNDHDELSNPRRVGHWRDIFGGQESESPLPRKRARAPQDQRNYSGYEQRVLTLVPALENAENHQRQANGERQSISRDEAQNLRPVRSPIASITVSA
jgi:hypothetical protein